MKKGDTAFLGKKKGEVYLKFKGESPTYRVSVAGEKEEGGIELCRFL